jgi:amidase
VHADCVAAAESAARLLESLGHHVEPSSPDTLADPELLRSVVTLITCSTARALDAWSEKTGRAIGASDVEPLTWAIAEMGRGLPATAYLRALEYTHAQARRIAGWWVGGFDLLLTPTQAEPPPPLGQFVATADDPLAGFLRAAPFSAFTAAFNATGQPAISLPLHCSADGLPIGVQFVAAYGREDMLIRVAAQLEQARPWAQRRPPVHG